ncbi:MAG TPA: glycoside hydrolase family 95 protein, partial [Asticcacaulis sp.]
MTFTRRHAAISLGASLGAFLAAPLAARAASGETPGPLSVWHRQPAAVWTEASPIGNGRLGAMVYGGVGREELQLNEDTLWAGGPYDPTHKGAVKNLAEVRRLIFAGRYKDAEALIEQGMMAQPERQMSYQTIGSLFLTAGPSSMASDYVRELDLDRALSRVGFTQDGARITRETFASPVDQVIVMRVRADRPGGVRLRLDYGTPQAARAAVDGADLILSGVNTSQQGVPAALRFEARVRVRATGGRLVPDGDGLILAGADEALILIAAATSFKSWSDTSGDPAALNTAVLANAEGKSFDDLLAAHVAAHRRLFRRVALDLGQGEAASLPTDARVNRADLASDPGLAALYYQFGRYLMIACSRPGTQAAGLQGLWNDRLNAPWGGKYTININTEMNYWPAERGALPECVGPLVDLVCDIARRGEETAREHYGARGWVCHHNTDI